MEEVKKLVSLESVKAFSDPYRLKILSVFRKMNRPATVKEISDQLKETPAKVHYHVKKLEKVDILVLVHTKEINGIIAKYYEPTAERFVIKYNDSNDKDLSKVVKAESQRLIASLYQNSRELVLEDMVKHDNEEGKKRLPQFVLTQDLYMTKEEAREFSKTIRKFTKKRKERENRQKYHFFSVLQPIYEDEEESKE